MTILLHPETDTFLDLFSPLMEVEPGSRPDLRELRLKSLRVPNVGTEEEREALFRESQSAFFFHQGLTTVTAEPPVIEYTQGIYSELGGGLRIPATKTRAKKLIVEALTHVIQDMEEILPTDLRRTQYTILASRELYEATDLHTVIELEGKIIRFVRSGVPTSLVRGLYVLPVYYDENDPNNQLPVAMLYHTELSYAPVEEDGHQYIQPVFSFDRENKKTPYAHITLEGDIEGLHSSQF